MSWIEYKWGGGGVGRSGEDSNETPALTLALGSASQPQLLPCPCHIIPTTSASLQPLPPLATLTPPPLSPTMYPAITAPALVLLWPTAQSMEHMLALALPGHTKVVVAAPASAHGFNPELGPRSRLPSLQPLLPCWVGLEPVCYL